MALYEEDMYADLDYGEAEGEADWYEGVDDYEDIEDVDEYEDVDALEEWDALEDDYDSWEDVDEYEDVDALEEWDALEDDYDSWEDADGFEEEEDALDNAMAYALGAEDEDEFFKKLFRGIKKVARKVAPVIGRVARVAAPILSKIPHPWAQAGGMAARLLSRLRAEGATEEEAMEAFAELAVVNRRALPIVAGLAARTLVKGKGRRLSFRQRKKIVKTMKSAAKALVRKRGPKAIRALPKITKSVKRTATIKRQPTVVKPMLVKKTANKVAKSPRLTKKLSKPSMKAKRIVKKTVLLSPARVVPRSYTIPGPARITISAV